MPRRVTKYRLTPNMAAYLRRQGGDRTRLESAPASRSGRVQLPPVVRVQIERVAPRTPIVAAPSTVQPTVPRVSVTQSQLNLPQLRTLLAAAKNRVASIRRDLAVATDPQIRARLERRLTAATRRLQYAQNDVRLAIAGIPSRPRTPLRRPRTTAPATPRPVPPAPPMSVPDDINVARLIVQDLLVQLGINRNARGFISRPDYDALTRAINNIDPPLPQGVLNELIEFANGLLDPNARRVRI
jgi:hypothetical protein